MIVKSRDRHGTQTTENADGTLLQLLDVNAAPVVRTIMTDDTIRGICVYRVMIHILVITIVMDEGSIQPH